MATFTSLRGLGSAPSVHGNEAQKAWYAAGQRLVAAHAKIISGKCHDAHLDLWPAHKAIGMAQAHSRSVDEPSRKALREMRMHVEDLDRETGKLFRERCVLR